jgi:hypothetical protein
MPTSTLNRAAALLLAVALSQIPGLVDRLVAVRSGEPWLLRWCRAASDHPGRTFLALACLTLALWKPRRTSARSICDRVVE